MGSMWSILCNTASVQTLDPLKLEKINLRPCQSLESTIHGQLGKVDSTKYRFTFPKVSYGTRSRFPP